MKPSPKQVNLSIKQQNPIEMKRKNGNLKSLSNPGYCNADTESFSECPRIKPSLRAAAR